MDRAAQLASIPLFESLAPEDLAYLADRLEEVPVRRGQAVFAEGSEGSAMYLIQSGGIEISIGRDKSKVVLADLFAGQYFGELSLFDGLPRSATATATQDSLLLALDRTDLVEHLTRKPDAAIRILAEMGERLRATNALMSAQVTRNIVAEVEEEMTLGQRVADRVASLGGSWTFVLLFLGWMASWMLLNLVDGLSWDAYPFILLNLMLSTLAALQAPIIMMSQNRQATKDKLLAQNDYQVNLKNELGIDSLLKGQAELLQRLAVLERKVKGGTVPPREHG